ncbi:MAG TPA: DUF2946 family protein [Dyella sp.]|uniref:DUF2946 family protein n=1 Tax=Dyella sp. TaxID=1869338 RepID=UPI002D78128F|nr:DUF2946 family protein [Dyella sp.]HET6555613.1 DUF2946 family protein [Dyella sp.]
MIRRRTPPRFVAWLAFAALWLLAVAPTISRTLPEVQWSPDLGAWCTSHGLDTHHPSTPDDPASHTDKCGYCALLGHSPLLGAATAVAVVAIPPLPATLAAHRELRWHAQPLLSANPRGPPAA